MGLDDKYNFCPGSTTDQQESSIDIWKRYRSV